MIISEDRQSHLAHKITDAIWNDDLVDYTDEDLALRLAKKAIMEFVKEDMDIDQKARDKVASLKRNVTEGTPEWDILYRKYYEEERNKRG
ncbi:MAG: DUF507 domain-containing protein [Bdellovibrio sp. CG10_big_fil_rev_8_21_14_0_10_47_8]|nr:MAG: DUF507 domain-containing protein [Bdellovibrio sp. CG10_big_fil_rev_8_21_14_0_10_47_8]